MPLNRSVKIFMLGVIVIAFQTNVFGQDEKVFNGSIEIWTDKETFLEVEEIPLYVRIINNENEGPHFSSVMIEHLQLRDSKGREYKRQIHIDYFGAQGPMKKGVREYADDLIYKYGIIDKKNIGVDSYLPPEQYTVQCVWNESGYVTIYSNIVAFSIISPNTKEEDVALSIYREAMKYKYHKERDPAAEKFDELLLSFPNSVYAPLALKYKQFYYQYVKPDYENYIVTSKRMLENYPNSMKSRVAIYALEYHYKNNVANKEEGRKYFEKIREKTKNEYLIRRLDEAIDTLNVEQ